MNQVGKDLKAQGWFLLCIAYLFDGYRRQRLVPLMAKTTLLGLAGIAVYIMLRWIYGVRFSYDPKSFEYHQMLLRNLTEPKSLYGLLLFNVFWVMAFVHAKRHSDFLRRMMPFSLLFVLLHFILARFYEVRDILPVAPIIIPAGMMVLFRETVLSKLMEGAKGADLSC